MEAFSLFELNEHIRRVIALNFQEPVWVRCEISQAKKSRGHYYLNLVEKLPHQEEIIAQMQGVIWSKTAWLLERRLKDLFGQIIQDGMEARLKVRVDFHERYGIKLVIDDIDPSFTLGNIEARRREIIESLIREGLIERNRGVRLPMVVQRIAVLSAEQAAGYQDFRSHLLHHPYNYRYLLDLYPVAVQGTQVEAECLAALAQVVRARHHYDCVVIMRGGGSRMDLAAFDSYALGKAIAECPLPVLTGIGHDIDHSVADAVAHTSLKTPTAVADFLTDINVRYESAVTQLFDGIVQVSRQRTQQYSLEVRHMAEMLRRAPATTLARYRTLLEQVPISLRQASRQHLQRLHERLVHSVAFLESLDPASILQRGFSITLRQGKRVRSAEEVRENDELITYFYQGKVRSIAKSS